MDIQEIIKNRYKELPADIQTAIRSTDLAKKFDLIAKKHSLHVDQNGALQTETILVMLGLEPTSNYVDNIKSELNISGGEAIAIAEDVNKEILNNIRASLRKLEKEESDEGLNTGETADETISSIEKAGQFTVERPVANPPLSTYADEGLNKAELLARIEDQPVPLIDHLLTTPVSNPQFTEVKTEIPKVGEKKDSVEDPYREQV